jgi:hypothetical protein
LRELKANEAEQAQYKVVAKRLGWAI